MHPLSPLRPPHAAARATVRDDIPGESRDACARCGAAFHCGMRDTAPCWCASLPPVPLIDASLGGCLCPACLAAALEQDDMRFAAAAIAPVADPALAERLARAIDAKTKPLGALGRIETIARQLGLIQQSLEPVLRRPHLLVFAADHGIAEEGVSAYPRSVTAQMVANFLAGGAAANVFAAQAGLELRIVDAGVAQAFPPDPRLIDRRIGAGTRNFAREPAMSADQARRALDAGVAIARELARNGCNALALGEMGIANSASAAALTARLTGLPPEACVGRGTGLDDAGLAHKHRVIAAALDLHADACTPLAALAAFGGFEIAMLAGAMLGAARARMIIVIDGFIVGAALLVARALAPAIVDYCVFAHRSAEHGHAALLEHLGVRPLLDLDLRLGEGSAAALAFPLVGAACAFLRDMASFESAGVDTALAGRTAR